MRQISKCSFGVFVLAVVVLVYMLTAVLAGDSHDRHVVVVNNSSYIMTKFYASNKSMRNWEEDILGTDVLPPGYRVRINVDDGSGYCIYDFKAVFSNGKKLEKFDVNVCITSIWTIRD